MKFLSPLDVRLNQDGTGELLKDFRFLSEDYGKAYTVPKGFITDFASVPRLPFAYLLAGNTAHWAAVIHDYLYRHAEVEPKEIADLVFHEAMAASGVPAWRRAIMFKAVSAFGRASYREQ